MMNFLLARTLQDIVLSLVEFSYAIKRSSPCFKALAANLK